MRVRDLGEGAGIVQAPGTKNAWRNRPVYVEPWARPYLMQLAKGNLPDVPVLATARIWPYGPFPNLAPNAGGWTFPSNSA